MRLCRITKELLKGSGRLDSHSKGSGSLVQFDHTLYVALAELGGVRASKSVSIMGHAGILPPLHCEAIFSKTSLSVLRSFIF